MKASKPILFSTPMVQAILDGRKTQTRRVVKFPIEYMASQLGRTDLDAFARLDKYGNPFQYENGDYPTLADHRPTYGKVGDILWVRETWQETTWLHPSDENHGYIYKASENGRTWESTDEWKWKPSIHMPKSACRIFLEITNVRVERLQDISRGDCISEGCPFPNIAKETDPITWYKELWQSINGLDSWDNNPWVWVIEFKRIEKPKAND